MHSSAARTNLTSDRVRINTGQIIGEGQFRYAYSGTYIGGNRNQQEAVCKAFKSQYGALETEFYQTDFQVASKAIQFAEDWNEICPVGKEILITYGSLKTAGGVTYLVEPLIRYFEKFTSNNGWIADENDVGWAVLAMEAFSHYTYHRSGGQMIVCDIQGRYRYVLSILYNQLWSHP
jgi:Alpha-kinase family